MENDCEVTIILLGESDVGKTSLALRFVENKFKDSPSRTIINKYEKDIQIERTHVKLTLWDTAGRKEYNDFVKNYYNVADGVLLIYDIRKPNTFSELSKWVTDFKSANKNAEILIAGNKSEEGSKSSVNLADVENFIRTEKIDCIEVSAKLSKNVDILFHHIVQKVLVAKGILKYSKDKQLTELEKSKSFISSNSVSPERLRIANTSSTVDVCSTTKNFVSCFESVQQNTSDTVNASTAAKGVDSCEESTEQSTSRTNNISSTTESLLNCSKSVKQNSSSTINTSKAAKPLIRRVASTQKNVLSSNNTSSATRSPLNCVEVVDENTPSAINTPTTAASLNTHVESTATPSNMLESASNVKTNGKLMENEVYEIEDDEDQPWKGYGNTSYSIGHSNFHYPQYYNCQGRNSDQDSCSVDLAESAAEYFEAREENSSRDKFIDCWKTSIHLSR